MTSTTGESKGDEAFTTIPDTGLVVRTARRGDVLIHFCAQVDNLGGGRTLLRARVDGEVAQPDLEPATIFSWDQELPQTRCMGWAVPRVGPGKHTIEIQWSNDLGGASRVSYRSLIVYAPTQAMQVTFEPGVIGD